MSSILAHHRPSALTTRHAISQRVGSNTEDERAREPKRLVLMPGGHFDAYVDGFDISSAAASDWFSQHLLTREPIPA
jgi:hypothetical protein